MSSNLKTKYQKLVAPQLKAEFDIGNAHAIPALSKIVVNMGTGELLKDKGAKQQLTETVAAITGQKPKVQPARVSVAGFGVREGSPVGLSVTLRGQRMWDFFEKLISIALPRLRDFRGVSRKSFDKHGNYTLGLNEYVIFPEVDLTKLEKVQGMQISIVTTTNSKKQAERLLELLGMPFAEKEE
jgi:large subunit ribosomal protein L5